jgi:predicted permease
MMGGSPGAPRRRHALDDLDQDIRDHIERETEDNIAKGMAPEEAHRQAMLAFGNVALAKEDTRRVWIWTWPDEARQDLRYAARTLLKNRAFAAAAAATLALAIGASTTMFSVLNAVLLRPLPYRAPEQLAMLWTGNPTQNVEPTRSSLWDLEQWRTQTQSFAEMAAFDAIGFTLAGTEGAERIVGASISPDLLAVLGVQPLQGRSFSIEEAEQRQRQVLISHAFWQARFGGASDAIGATLVLDGLPSRIIGIIPPGFQLATVNADVWEPLTMSQDWEARHSGRGSQTWFVVGRLRPGVSLDQAQMDMSAIARRVDEQLPAAERNRGISVVPLRLRVVGSDSRLALWMLGGAVCCVFLIAAANVASLSLARSVGRAREMAVRAALGASAGRIVRQLLTESVLLGAVSGVMGTLLAFGGIRLIRAFGPGGLPRLREAGLDLRVLWWALAISLLAGILVGLAPAITTLRRNLRPHSEEGGRSVAGGAAIRRIRSALVVAEFALAIVVLIGAGLLLRSWWHVKSIDPAFMPERVLMMEFNAPTTFKASAQRADLYHRVLEQIQGVPGVEGAGIIGDMFKGNPSERLFTAEGGDGTATVSLPFTRDEVSPDFFTTLGTPLLRGRFFSIGDGPDAPRVAIVNDALARRAWLGRDPLGRRFKLGPRESDRPWYTVVGVVGDMRRQAPEREPVLQIFEPLAQSAPGSVDLFIRTSSDDPLAMAGALRTAVHRVETHAPIFRVTPLETQLGLFLAQRRFQTSLLTGFAVVALLMAAVGIYGLIQYSVAIRTPEIGLRIAMGAQARDIFRMIVGEGLVLSLTGLALGIVGAWWLGRAAASLLFGVTATDPLTFVTVSLLMIAVAIAASYFPARRAMKVQPVEALRVT